MATHRDRSIWAGVALLLVTSAPLAAQDRWFARDKAKHFAASSVIATGGYWVGSRLWDSKRAGLALGAGLSLSAGVAKELRDSFGHGQASWKDMTWNLIGLATALGISWGLDSSRGTEDPSTPATADWITGSRQSATYVADPLSELARWGRQGSTLRR